MSRDRSDKTTSGVIPTRDRHKEIDPDTHMTGGVIEDHDDWVIEDDE